MCISHMNTSVSLLARAHQSLPNASLAEMVSYTREVCTEIFLFCLCTFVIFPLIRLEIFGKVEEASMREVERL